MDLLERLRPRWRRSDPDVRAAAVREMGPEDQARLETVAREDPDARVRRIAIKKLADAECLDGLAGSDSDAELRAFAAERALEVRGALASSDAPLAACEAALARVTDERMLTTIAATAMHDAVRHGALARITGDRGLRDVVRGANDPAIRRAALERIADVAVLRSIAVGDGPADVALAAVGRITDADALRAIADSRNASKGVRQRAQALLAAVAGERARLGAKEGRARQLALCAAVERLIGARDLLRAADEVRALQTEWTDLARDVPPRDDVARRFQKACEATLEDADSVARRRAEAEAARTAHEQHLAAREALCARVEGLADSADPATLDEAVAAWGRLAPIGDDRDAAVAHRFRAACESATQRHRHWIERDAQRGKLEAVVVEIEALAAATPVPPEKVWRALDSRWTGLVASAGGTPEVLGLKLRVAAAAEQYATRRQEADAQRDAAQRTNLKRLETLSSRLQDLTNAESLDVKAARRELRAAEAAVADLGPLPPSEKRAEWSKRLAEGRDELLRKLRQAEEADEWRRWANVAAQEEIIQRVEALLASDDLAEGTRQLGRLQEEWAAVASATADKAQALWDRFRTVRNELRKRSDAYLDANLEKKRALIAQVADLGESTTWNETADLIKRLQAEWKDIGPVPMRHAQTLWLEFRAPCDRFFSRRKEHFARVDGERRTAAAAKLALCEKAEALADSTDWDATTTVMKRLQAQWKETAPLPRAQGEELWQRFRKACDRFFDRRSRRDELAQEALLQQAAGVCDRVDALAASLQGEDAPGAEDIGKALDEAWGTWLHLDVATLEGVEPLAERLHAACRQIAAAQPDALRGTRLDPAATRPRREKLCARLEKLVDAAHEAPRERSLQEMALALRERLASNTIGSGDATPTQGPAREIERLDASWALLGPILDDAGEALAERFARARARATPA